MKETLFFHFVFLSPFLYPLSSAQAKYGCSSESEYRVAKAAECLEHKDVGCAKLKLEPVLASEPDCGSALFVKGWITEYFDGKQEEGKALQDRAVKIDSRLSTFWEDRGHAIESRLSSQSFSNFDVQFDGAQDRDKAWDAVKYLNEMYGDLGALFGVHPKKRIPVIIFTTGEFLQAWRAPFIGGFFDRRDGKIRIRVDETPGGAEEFRHRARHEMTHAFIYQLYPKEIPSWASEGIAEYCARNGISRGFWKEDRLEEIRKTRKGFRWLTLADINTVISSKSGSLRDMYLAYLESEALVLWIAKDRGDSWVPRVIKYLAENGGTFDAAYTTLYGVAPAVEMERLRRYWE